jgi:YaaC-like protein
MSPSGRGEDSVAEQRIVRLDVVNPGFDRDSLTTPSTPPRQTGFFSQPVTDLWPENPWARLQWWESPLQAQEGITALCANPFVSLKGFNESRGYVPTQLLYADALRASQLDRVERAAKCIAANIRQAREQYVAAQSAAVTELSRPLNYYYGALSLAKAATAALFGTEHVEAAHGLGHEAGPSDRCPDRATWPTVITWQRQGAFPMLYLAARWDTVFERWGKLGFNGRPKFHVLECIRFLGYEWGTLPPTGFSRPGTLVVGRREMEKRLLLYREDGSLFMRRNTPLTATVFELPNVLVQFMLLYYFSVMARYHIETWQELLGGATDREGYVFRYAHEEAAQDFAREIARMLPYPDELTLMAPPDWIDSKAKLVEGWYRWPEEVDGLPANYLPVYQPKEWPGPGPSTDAPAEPS